MFASNTEIHLNPPQREITARGLLSSGFNCILQLPTGSGKTWLAEQTIGDCLQKGGRVVYLTPLRALASELLERWRVRFSEYSVGAFTGEHRLNGVYPISFEASKLLIMTPERLDACTRNWRSHWTWIPKIDLLVVDEFHLLAQRERGSRLEGALNRFRRLNPFVRILGLSATMGNRTELSDWLKGVDFGSEWRFVPLRWRVSRFKKASDKRSILLTEMRNCVKNGGQALVFVQSRRRAEQLSAFLKDEQLCAAHHHAGLNHIDRKATEASYRSRTLDILISTGTLEMGVNLPARLVVLYDLQGFNGLDFVPLSVNTVWQRAGRAGRRGLDDAGDVLLIAPTWAKGIERYLRGDFENIQSQLGSEAALAEQVVIEVASGLVKNQTQLHRCFDSTLAKHQQRLGDLDSVLHEMLEAGMLAYTLKKGRTCLEATGLGRIAVRQMLRPRTVASLSRRLRSDSAQDLTFLDLLLIAIGTSDCQPKLPTDFEELDGLSDLLGQERSILLEGSTASVLKRFRRSGRHLLDTIKTALAIRAWTQTGDAESVAEDFGCYSFEIRRLVESLERILSAAVSVLSPSKDEAESVALEEDVPIRQRIQALREMVSYGIHEEAVSLTGIGGIAGKLARRLLRIGITDIEDMAQAEAEDVAMVQGISLKRASSLIEEANRVMEKRSAFYFRETGPTIRSVLSEWPSSIDPYRLNRARELVVRSVGTYEYVVRGGLEPHRVFSPREGKVKCDCLDFAKGNLCKHILALRMYKRDRKTLAMVKKLKQQRWDEEGLSLFALWFQGNTR